MIEAIGHALSVLVFVWELFIRDAPRNLEPIVAPHPQHETTAPAPESWDTGL